MATNQVAEGIINIVDTTFIMDAKISINYIIAVASTDNPICDIRDINGNSIFYWDVRIANTRTWGITLNGQRVHGLRSPTMTNITKVIIGYNP
jgi:hypothetical protein